MIDINIIENDDLLYEYLQTLDYYKLDYSDDTNLYFVIKYIEFKIILGYNDYHDILINLKNYSLICYYCLLKKITQHAYYDDKILEIVPSNIIEKIKYKIILETDKIYSNDINIKNNIIDELNIFINDLTKDNNILNIVYKNRLLILKNGLNDDVDNKKIIYCVMKILETINRIEYNKTLEILDLIKDNKIINKDFYDFLCFKLHSLMNDVIDIDKFLDYYNKLYTINNNKNIIREIYIINKYDFINRIVFIINRSNNQNKLYFINKINKIYEQYKKDDELDEHMLSLNNIINIEYLMYTMMSNYTSDIDTKNNYINLSISAILRTQNLNKKPYKILDLIIIYYNNKKYEKALEHYKIYKDLLLEKLKTSSILIKLYNILIGSYINTHQIQNIDDLYLLINNLEYNEYLKNDFTNIDKFKILIETMNKVLSYPKFNFNLIHNYDLILDEKCLRDSDNKIMCLICLENIEIPKITLVQCKKCNKYIGHMLCIYNYICNKKGINVKCINCQQ